MRKNQERMEFDPIDEQVATLLICEPDTTDLQGQQMSREVIREMQQSYNSFGHWGIQHLDKRGRLYDLERMDQPEIWRDNFDDSFEMLDSFITSGPTIINNQQILEGSWIGNVHVLDKNIWQKMKDEELTGVSVGGLKIALPINSHSQIISGIVGELSLCNRAATGRKFLMLKGMDMDILRQPISGWHSCRIREPSEFQPDSFKTIESKDGRVNLIIARPVGSQKMGLQAIRYPISKYDINTARSHCESKGGKFEAAKEGD